MNMGVAGSSSPSTRFQGELIVCLPRLEKTVRQTYRLELSKIGGPPSRPGSDGKHFFVSQVLCSLSLSPAKQVL